MRLTIYPWHQHEMLQLTGESRPGRPPDEGARELFGRFNEALKAHGLSLDDTVRSRLWGRDRAARDGGSGERVKVLSGKARSASSSYISPDHFDSAGSVAIDLWAMRGAGQKTVKEYDPPIVPPRYIVADGLVFLSGVTWDKGALDEQLKEILPRIGGSLEDAGVSWSKVVRLSFHLHRSQKLDDLRKDVLGVLGADLGKVLQNAQVDYEYADGYSTPGKLVEIETTAVL